MYEAVSLDPWASCGVAYRIVELDRFLIKRYLEDLMEDATVGVRRARYGAREVEAKDLEEVGINGALSDTHTALGEREENGR